MPRSPVMLTTNVDSRTARTSWVRLSRANSRSSRGENCCDASCSATTVSENVTVTAVITLVATACRSVEAASMPLGQIQRAHAWSCPGRTGSSSRVTASAAREAQVGQNHTDALRASRSIRNRRAPLPAGCDAADSPGLAAISTDSAPCSGLDCSP